MSRSKSSPEFGANTYRRLKELRPSEASMDPEDLGPTTFGWEHFRTSEPSEVAEQLWVSLPAGVLGQLRDLLPAGAAGLGKRRKNQRYYLGLRRPSGVLLGWRSSSNRAQRSKFAVIWCQRCHRVWEIRMDHFMGNIVREDTDGDCNRSCGCGAEANRELILETALLQIKAADQSAIAQELELGRDPMEVARHFRLKDRFLPWLKSGFVRYLMAHIWKLWAEDLWYSLGDQKRALMWAYVQKHGIRQAALTFKRTIAEVKAVCRYCKKAVSQAQIALSSSSMSL